DGGEQDNEQTQNQGVGNQYAAISKAPQNARHRHLEAHGGQRLGHHEKAGLNRRKPEDHLVKQRKEEGDSADAQTGEKAPADRRAKGPNTKQAQPEQRKLGARSPQSVTGKRSRGNHQQPQHGPSAQRVLTEYFQHVGQQRDAAAEQDESDGIERVGVFFSIVREMSINQIQPEQANRQVDEKDDSPMKVPNDQTAGDGPEHRANQTGYGNEAHGADEFRFGERPHHGEPAHGQHHGAAAALQDATRDEDVDIARNATETRPQSEQAKRGREHPACAEAIGHPAADR